MKKFISILLVCLLLSCAALAEGAPVVAEGRLIDETAPIAAEVSGVYEGTVYPECEFYLFDEPEDNFVGSLVLYTGENYDIAYEGEVIEVIPGWYEISGADVSVTVYTQDGIKGLDLYIDGEHADYLTCSWLYAENAEGESQEAGAPVVAEDRRIDQTAHSDAEICGMYAGDVYPKCELAMYSDPQDNFVGVLRIYDADDNTIYEGEVIEVMDNWYEISGENVSVTVYEQEGVIGLDLYIDGVHADYLLMTENTAA